jgi:hypothetical protein
MNGYHATAAHTSTARRTCHIAGCPCEDARIVSHRRAAFFRAVAHAHGQTADRRIDPETDWRIPFGPGAA